MNFLNCRNFLKARGFLTCWHLFTFFTVAPFLSTTLVILDFCFILVASNTGSRRCYFPCCSILQGNFPNFGMEILDLRSAKSFRDLFFLILFSCSTQLFKNYLKQTQDFLLFPIICRWHVIVQIYRNKKLNILIITCQSKEKNTNQIYLNSNVVK